MCAVFLREAMETVESAARTVLAACSEGDALRTNLAVLKRFTKFEPVNAIAAGAGSPPACWKSAATLSN